MDNREWTYKTAQARARYGMSPQYMPWTKHSDPRPALRGLQCTARVEELLNIAWMAGGRALPLYLDASQCVSRKPWSKTVPCLTTSSTIYDYSLDCTWTANCKLAVQGVPIGDLDVSDLTPQQKSDLAGEAMFLPDVGSIVVAFFLSSSGPWWQG